MSKLLVSVTSVEEALLAMEGGADIIDMKNPHLGALGALPLTVVAEAVSAINGQRVTSATTGDLPMQPDIICQAVMQMATTGVDIIKVGFFGSHAENASCISALQPLIQENNLHVVAVLMADMKPTLEVVALLRQAGFFGVMLDTARKNGQTLLSHLTINQLQNFLYLADGMQTGLAGSLAIEHIEQLLAIKPSYIGVRGAVCWEGSRIAKLCKNRVSAISTLLYNCNKLVENIELA